MILIDLYNKFRIVCFCVTTSVEPAMDVFKRLVELHLTFEQRLFRALDIGRKEWVGFLLHHPVEVLDAEHLGVDVGLDVVAEAVDVVSELIDRP